MQGDCETIRVFKERFGVNAHLKVKLVYTDALTYLATHEHPRLYLSERARHQCSL